MALPHTADDAIRIHDIAIFDWLESLKFHYPEIPNPVDATRVIAAKQDFPIIRVMASPSRAYASIIDTLIWQNWIPETDGQAMRDLASDNLAVLPLPACSIQRSDPRPDTDLSNPAFVWQKGFFNCDTGQWDYYRWPKSWLTDYTITFWATNVFSKAFWLEWAMAQFGNKGMGVNETVIPVTHQAPFGTINARLQFGGMTDLTELEGDEQRYTRSELTVTLRTWITMPKLMDGDIPTDGDGCGDGSEDSGGIGQPIFNIQNTYKVNGAEEQQSIIYQTCNLWHGLLREWSPYDFCRDWPVEGNGAIVTSDKVEFEIAVAETTDRVQLWGLPTQPDPLSIVGFSFDYDLDAPMTLEVEQLDGTTEGATPEPVFSTTIVKEIDGRFHQFFLTNKNVVSAYLKGTGNNPKPQSMQLTQPDLRIVSVLPRIIGTKIVGAPESKFEFYNLPETAYLVILKFSGTPSGPYTVRLENDITTPDYVTSAVVNSAVNTVGVVLMNQPKSDSLSLIVDNNIVIEEVWAQPYEGYYNGHDA